MSGRRRKDECGVATMLALGLMCLLLLGTVVGVGIVQVIAARHDAAAAADLGALAGAAALTAGDPCSAAARTVRANDAELVACRVAGADVVVTTSVRTLPLLGIRWEPRVSARAGPA